MSQVKPNPSKGLIAYRPLCVKLSSQEQRRPRICYAQSMPSNDTDNQQTFDKPNPDHKAQQIRENTSGLDGK
jgi:hypothetical protein